MLEAAITGGSVLGGGGGGHPEAGAEMGRLALASGTVSIVDIGELQPDDTIVTVGLVGALGARNRYVTPAHYVRALRLLERHAGKSPAALISNENGALASVNGWLQSAVAGVPVLDAPCNGRAHPLVTMGSMGLHRREGYTASTAVVGGNPKSGSYLEAVVASSVQACADVARDCSIVAGGLVAVARNPVEQSYVVDNAAVGGLSHAIEIGAAVNAARPHGPAAMIEAAAKAVRGTVCDYGEITGVRKRRRAGLDVGEVQVTSGARQWQIRFCNEYLTLESSEERIASFPDLIVLLSLDSGLPVLAAECVPGTHVALVHASADQLLLGAGMRDPTLFRHLGRIAGVVLNAPLEGS